MYRRCAGLGDSFEPYTRGGPKAQGCAVSRPVHKKDLGVRGRGRGWDWGLKTNLNGNVCGVTVPNPSKRNPDQFGGRGAWTLLEMCAVKCLQKKKF